MKFINTLLSALPLLVALNVQAAADDILKPFVLGSKGAGTVAEARSLGGGAHVQHEVNRQYYST